MSILNLDTLNPHVKAMEYAVLGPLQIRAMEIEKELEHNGVSFPFNEIINMTIGDCHATGQKPLTFLRQVLALTSYPALLNDPKFPEDAKSRARDILQGCRGESVGSYSPSPGLEVIRRHCAEYIEKRDGGIPSDWQNIVLSNGASDGIRNIIKLLNCPIDGKKPGILIPIPQYPVYSATLTEFDMHNIGYYLDEKINWGLDLVDLERSVREARKICNPRAIVVINPGNPTGQVLSRQNIEEIIKFAYKEKLYVLADEVYQDNIYCQKSEFHSFKKVMNEMGEPYNKLEVASFMSCSKGCMGECGLRGGYVEVVNMLPEVKAMYMKAITAMLCPSVLGQVALDVSVKPPLPEEPSYELYMQERAVILGSLAEKAKLVEETFNSIEGYSCNIVQGALYAFPQIKLPPKAIEAAKKLNQEPDFFYAYQLLESTGVCIVPGSGFGQQEGTFHFRTTILPQTDKLKVMLESVKKFHGKFLQQYS